MRFLDIYVVTVILSSTTKIVTSQFQNLPSDITVPENTPGSSSVFTILIATFPVNHIDYLIQYEPSSGSDKFILTWIFNGFDVAVRPDAILDYETLPNQYRITVIDQGATEGSGEGELPLNPPSGMAKRQAVLGPAGIGVLVINITDVNEPPRFGADSYFITVQESKIPLDPFIRLPSPAFDEDVNETLLYEINVIFPKINDKQIFEINSTTGNIILLGEYDVDNNVHPDALIITINAVDGSGLSNTTMLFVDIDDINDNDPIFTGTGNYVMLLPYDYAGISGTAIGYVHADDADGSDTVTYSLSTQNMYFSVESSTGTIQLTYPFPVNTGVFQFSIVASTSKRLSLNPTIANVTVYVVPFCTAAEENGCDLCNDSSSVTTTTTTTTTSRPIPNRRKRADEIGTVNTCPKTTCSRCRDYITSTCQSGTVPLSSLQKTPACSASQNGDVSSADLRVCWILPLVIAVGVAAVVIGWCLYTRQKRMRTAPGSGVYATNTRKPDITTVESLGPTTELGNFRKPNTIQG